ncbi:MAG: winged helix-turn-helix transcriptional regulator [Acidobacteria bacterium]|nr:winged helix-turn-helix transcriptional regulator [Acidobacteriota bacterium]
MSLEQTAETSVAALASAATFNLYMKSANQKKATDLLLYEMQANICKAFAHPKRLQILDLLGDGEMGVSELQEKLEVSKTNVSQHLTILKSAGVLKTRRSGKQTYCSLTIPEVKQACQLISKVLRAQIAHTRSLTD